MPPVSPFQEVVVICMTGHRSPLVAYALKKRGYARVDNLAWGMVGWKVYEWGSHLRGRGRTAQNQAITPDHSARRTARPGQLQLSGRLALAAGSNPPRPVIRHPGSV